jgi:quercetin dioxygenase-like cupin family protein
MHTIARTGLAFAAMSALLVGASAASATPPTGKPDLPTPGPALIGELDGGTKAKHDGIQLKVRSDTLVRTFTLTYPVGSSSGWHSHPGIVLATVQQGTVVRRVGCTSQEFTVGQSFTEAAPHKVSNAYRKPGEAGAVDAVLAITQLVPADAKATRIEQDAPRCS